MVKLEFQGYSYFLIFDQKHRLWVLVRTASARPRRGGSNLYIHTINVLSNIIKNIKKFPMKSLIFTAEKVLCILHGQVVVMGKTFYIPA